MPLELAPARDELVAHVQRSDEPLPARDDFERPIALLEELHGMRDRPRLAEEVAALPQQFNDAGSRLHGREPGELVVVPLRLGLIERGPPVRAPRHGAQRAVRLDDRADAKTELPPPRHVRRVAERADHRDAGSLFRIGEGMRAHGDTGAEERRRHVLSKQRLVPFIIGMRHESHACRQQFGTGRVDFDKRRTEALRRTCAVRHSSVVRRPRVAIGDGKPDAVVRARHFTVFELSLGDGGFEIHVPQRRRLELIRPGARVEVRLLERRLEELQEGPLRHSLRLLTDGRVRHRPVDGKAQVLP